MKTSLYSILCIVIRLGAVFWAASIITWLPEIYAFAHASRPDAGSFHLLVLHYLGGLAVAFVLWLYPGILAKLVAGRSTKEPFETLIGVRDIQYIAFSVLGMWLVLKGSGAFAFEVSRWVAFSRPEASMAVAEVPQLVAAGAQIILGIGLTLGAKGLVAGLHHLRFGNQKWEES